MNIHLLCIGNELLLGDTLNTNLAFLGERLGSAGLEITREVCLPDKPDLLREEIGRALQTADLLVTIGGLGATSDDVTRQTVADVLGRELREDATIAAKIRDFLKGRHRTVPEKAVQIQSQIITGAEVMPNANGSAPGLWCEHGKKTIALLPGPPREFGPLVENELLPRILERWAPEFTLRLIRTTGMFESEVAAIVEPIAAEFPDVSPAYCAKPTGTLVRLQAGLDAIPALEEMAHKVRLALPNHLLPEDCTSLAEAVGRLLLARNLMMGTAESCTGGGIAAMMTDIPGSSAYFSGAAVTYSNEWKQQLLGVRPETLRDHGAVSAETIAEMLDGLRERYRVGAGIAVSGVAGPGGGSPEKPVGLVFVGIEAAGKRKIFHPIFSGNRETVRTRTVGFALSQLHELLLSIPVPDDG